MASRNLVGDPDDPPMPLSELDGSEMAAIVESAPDGMLLVDVDGLILAVNRRIEAMFGYDRGELLGRPVEVLVPDASRSAHVRHRHGYSAGPTIREMGTGRELLGQRADGSEFPIEVALGPLDERVRGAAVIACVRDVSETRALRAQVAAEQRRFESVFHESPVGMRLTRLGADGERTIVAANEAFADLVGRPLSELIGADVDDLVDPDDRDAAALEVDAMLRAGRERSVIEKRLLRLDGSSVWVLVDTSIVQRDPEVLALSHVLDISDRRARNAQQRRLERMEDRERIGRGLHDMVIQRLFATGMDLHSLSSDDLAPDVLARVRSAVDELDATIREIRTTIFELDDVPTCGEADQPPRLLVDIESERSRLAISSTMATSGDLERVPRAVASEIVPAIREMLSNVARHSRATQVMIDVTVGPADIEIVVTDDGAGFTSASPRGNGLGNLEARAADLGGTCTVESAVGEGTVVRWTVPI